MHEFVIYSLPIFRLWCRNIHMYARLCIAMIICIIDRTERTVEYTQFQPISRDIDIMCLYSATQSLHSPVVLNYMNIMYILYDIGTPDYNLNRNE